MKDGSVELTNSSFLQNKSVEAINEKKGNLLKVSSGLPQHNFLWEWITVLGMIIQSLQRWASTVNVKFFYIKEINICILLLYIFKYLPLSINS